VTHCFASLACELLSKADRLPFGGPREFGGPRDYDIQQIPSSQMLTLLLFSFPCRGCVVPSRGISAVWSTRSAPAWSRLFAACTSTGLQAFLWRDFPSIRFRVLVSYVNVECWVLVIDGPEVWLQLKEE
jgi:hypothetical protein